jgi:APA family basic amino acid/polyamine antiporter
MALTVGYYVWPAYAHAVAVAAVVVLTALNYAGIHKSALLTRVIVALVLAVLAAVVLLLLGFGDVDVARLGLDGDVTVGGVLESAGMLFFAFAGYARIATLGEEVRDPSRTIPRAIAVALAIALVVYVVVAVAVLAELGSATMASATAPLGDAVTAAGFPTMEPAVRAGAAVAALGSLLALILGVSRTTLAMARDRHLPHRLSAVHPKFGSPHRAEIAVGIVVAVLAATVDLRGAIGFSSFAVLVYYAITNASAFTLGRKVVPVTGFIGCSLLAFSLPLPSVLVGACVLAAGAVAYRLKP